MDKIKKTNMNIKKITIAMLITLISIGNINAQEMKTEIPKISEFPTGNENTVVEIAPNVEHWHGASPDSWFSHIAVECNPQTNKNTWLEPVSDEEYGKAVNDK